MKTRVLRVPSWMLNFTTREELKASRTMLLDKAFVTGKNIELGTKVCLSIKCGRRRKMFTGYCNHDIHTGFYYVEK